MMTVKENFAAISSRNESVSEKWKPVFRKYTGIVRSIWLMM